MCQEDVIKKQVEVEDFPCILAELSGCEDSDDDGEDQNCNRSISLRKFIVSENQQDVLEGYHEGKDHIDHEEEDILFHS